MLRANEDPDDNAPPPKRQATLGAFYKRSDGTDLAVDRFVPDDIRLKCPYCDFYAVSKVPSALNGNLKNHCVHKHPIESLEATTRVAGAFNFIQSSIFEFSPLPTIAEFDEEERVYLQDEVGQMSDSESDNEDVPEPRRAHPRRRWCLDGCDCERQRGRKCNCELRGGQFCSDRCGCDPSKCRARRQSEENDV